MNGLTVRWSLAGLDDPDATARDLAALVAGSSHARFTGMAGLRHATWRLRPGAWFEADLVFVDDAARAAFQTDLEARAADSPGSRLVGRPPEVVEACLVLAVAEGWDGFEAAASVERP
ncbi:hypothetical protein [Nocardioides sp. GY 10127]|uniref:hypothetical protein n=1 Tax=Nocardioides sp. GY 10127 TaxID=2569762 RepID=UPI0010A858A3|nr:hypothetical protein [Nocardioides sp. GY 10127]TIC81655.1 hypothetical protein E8D37_10660 [Nocardioides sp. GY 10127]